jgi:hypothetical protein
MKLTCLCTHNAMCSLCRDVLVLRMIAGRLFTAGDQARGMVAVDLAGAMDLELTDSYRKRNNGEDRSPSLYPLRGEL